MSIDQFHVSKVEIPEEVWICPSRAKSYLWEQITIPMKYALTLAIFLIALTSFGQKIKVTESEERIAGGKNPALVVSIYEVNVDKVRNEWKSLMKDYKAKKIDMADEIKSDNTIITTINDNNSIDISAKIEKVSDNETKMTVAFYLGGAFLSSANNQNKCNAAKQFLSEFAVKTTKEAIIAMRKLEEKKLSNMQDEQKDLERKQEKLVSSKDDYTQKIEEYKQKIKEAEDNMVKNKADQEKKKQEIVVQSKALEGVLQKEKAVE